MIYVFTGLICVCRCRENMYTENATEYNLLFWVDFVSLLILASNSQVLDGNYVPPPLEGHSSLNGDHSLRHTPHTADKSGLVEVFINNSLCLRTSYLSSELIK